MALTAGTRLGPYEILALIGAGGMGEVYKANDTRLDRTVAIKVLPTEISGDPQRRARFEREAHSIATLSHPHICTLHDVGEHASSLFLVMEHLEGQTLAERLRRGALPIDQALEYGAQIAEALSVAHRAGIIHRDLKPGNVMLTKSGVKLLDFGLAKRSRGPVHAAAGTGCSASTVEPLTSEGALVGTVHYMAPEQLEGQEADARTDIWALGLVLYEMVTGKRAFKGQSSAAVIAAILEREPVAISSLQPLAPEALERLVQRCLAKSRDDRPDTAHDLVGDLRSIQERHDARALAVARRFTTVRAWPAVAWLAIGAGLGAIAILLARPVPPDIRIGTVVRSELSVRAEELNAVGGSRTALTWVPGEQGLVFVGRRTGAVQQLFLRQLDAAEALPLPGTEGAQAPAVSTDGKWVAFWAQGRLKKVPLAGGPVTDLASEIEFPPTGILWDHHGRLFFGKFGEGILQLDPGGVPKSLTKLSDVEHVHVPSSVLPGGRHILFTSRKMVWTWGDEEVVAVDVATGQRKILLHDGADARYVATGHLVFLRRSVLFAVPFDLERLEVTGAPVAVLEGVAQALKGLDTADFTGAGQFTISTDGSIAWIAGTVAPPVNGTLVSMERSGHRAVLGAPVRDYGIIVRVSPNGRQLAVTILSLTELGLWIYEFDRSTLVPLYRSGEATTLIWSPDGARLLFNALEQGRHVLRSQVADASAPPDVLVEGDFAPLSWDGAGKLLGLLDGQDPAVVRIENGLGTIRHLGATADVEWWPQVSPDGRWLLYGSRTDAAGFVEIYVRPHPGGGARFPISVNGGNTPAWNPNGRELFYVSRADTKGKRRMMAVDFLPGAPPRIGTPRPLFEYGNDELIFTCYPIRCYDVSPDGQRFYVVQMPTSPPPVVTRIDLIQNWFEELKAKVPVNQ